MPDDIPQSRLTSQLPYNQKLSEVDFIRLLNNSAPPKPSKVKTPHHDECDPETSDDEGIYLDYGDDDFETDRKHTSGQNPLNKVPVSDPFSSADDENDSGFGNTSDDDEQLFTTRATPATTANPHVPPLTFSSEATTAQTGTDDEDASASSAATRQRSKSTPRKPQPALEPKVATLGATTVSAGILHTTEQLLAEAAKNAGLEQPPASTVIVFKDGKSKPNASDTDKTDNESPRLKTRHADTSEDSTGPTHSPPPSPVSRSKIPPLQQDHTDPSLLSSTSGDGTRVPITFEPILPPKSTFQLYTDDSVDEFGRKIPLYIPTRALGAPEPLSKDTLPLLTLTSDLRKELEKKGLISDPFEVKPDFTPLGTDSFESHLRMSRKPKTPQTVRAWAEDATKPTPVHNRKPWTRTTRTNPKAFKPVGVSEIDTRDIAWARRITSLPKDLQEKLNGIGHIDTKPVVKKMTPQGTASWTDFLKNSGRPDTQKTFEEWAKTETQALGPKPKTVDPTVQFLENLDPDTRKELIRGRFVVKPGTNHVLTRLGRDSLDAYAAANGPVDDQQKFNDWATAVTAKPEKPDTTKPTHDFLVRKSVRRAIEPYTKPSGEKNRTVFDKKAPYTHTMGTDTDAGETADTSKPKRRHVRSNSEPIIKTPFTFTPKPKVVTKHPFLRKSDPSKIPPAGPKRVVAAKIKVVPLVKTAHASSAAPPVLSSPVLASPPAALPPQPLSQADLQKLAHKFWEALFKTGAETIFKVLRTTDFITQYEAAPRILDAAITQERYPGILSSDLERLKTQILDELFGNPLRLKIGPNTCAYELRQISATYGIEPPDLSFQPVF